MKNMINISDEKILRIITQKSREKEIHLTMTEKAFFVLFIHFCMTKGNYDKKNDTYSVFLPSVSIAKELGYCPNFVNKAMLKLKKCEFIQRVYIKKDEEENETEKYVTKKPYKTILNMSLFR